MKKYALVTGGSGDIGKAICKRLANDGYFVLVHANSNLNKAQQIVHEIKEEQGDAVAIQFDVTNYEQTSKSLSTLATKTPIQLIVHNAGIHDDVPLAGMQQQQWGKVIDVSLNGFFNVTQPLLLPMMKTRWGRVIAVGSIAGITGNRGQANYAAAKSGLSGACKSLSLELASRGITANVIAPGIIETNMSKDAFPKEKIKQLVPMQRAGTASEVASLVSFLASDEAAYISGQVIAINGGMI
ncbi:MAG: 3-oxoacyl-ACP reductase FabG [Gammaproteobacteria bacterium]|nr:3-oxoacyl-ACP reductase FabG [Gammaproteobacteria bacterium]